MNREAVTREELHRIFSDALAREAPAGSRFTFEIDARVPGADGCNWYPLAAIGSWEGDLTSNLAVFRRIRERLSAEYNLHAHESVVVDAGAHAEAAAG